MTFASYLIVNLLTYSNSEGKYSRHPPREDEVEHHRYDGTYRDVLELVLS